MSEVKTVQQMNSFSEIAYTFKRDFYYSVESALNEHSVVFLLGPRKCGKTVCLKQLNEQYKNSKYVDVKTLKQPDRAGLIDTILSSIMDNRDTLYLIDEITYLDYADVEISRLAEVLSSRGTGTKVVLTGSQSVALRSWGYRAFSSFAGYVKADFINYKEWVAYKQTCVSEESFNDFILNTDKFYKFNSLSDYLRGSLEETVISNHKSQELIFNNDVTQLDESILISVLYTVMLTLHNHVTLTTIAKPNYFADNINYYRDLSQALGSDNILSKIEHSVIGGLRKLKTISFQQFKDALIFLCKNDLITLTVVTDDLEKQEDVLLELTSIDCKYTDKSDLLKRVNVCINYPMFYVALLKDVLTPTLQLPSYLLGGIVECYLRGLLVRCNNSLNSCSYEYHDAYDNEIDYVDYVAALAIEFTVANKKITNTHFDLLPDSFTKILLTKDKECSIGDVRQEIYYKFIYDVCERLG